MQPIPAGLRPALLAPYRNLDALRHDFPVVFAAGQGEYVVSLSAAVDGALRAVAPAGTAGEGMRKRALQVERDTATQRRCPARPGPLRALWDAAVEKLQPATQPEAYRRDMARVRDALAVDGELAGCDATLAARFVRHAWLIVQREKARAARERIDQLMLRLENILRADFARSAAAIDARPTSRSRSAWRIASCSISRPCRACCTSRSHGADCRRCDASASRQCSPSCGHRRSSARGRCGRGAVRRFRFRQHAARRSMRSCAGCRTCWRCTRPLQAAELEVEGLYVEDLHDPIFAGMDEQSLTVEDLQFFPDFLVCTSQYGAPDSNAALTEALASGVPLKVMVQLDDLLEQAAPGRARFAFGMRGANLATAAMSLGEAFVLQSPVSNLLQARDAVQRGLRFAGPALFSIYCGATAPQATVPTYLAAAAAIAVARLPRVLLRPGGGPRHGGAVFARGQSPARARLAASRRSTTPTPDLQSVTEELAFTFVDFAAVRPALRRPLPRRAACRLGRRAGPGATWLEHPPADPSLGVPSVAAVDEADLLCRLVVDDQLMRAALRCRETWHRLQELAGIRDSRLERALAQERQAWDAARAARVGCRRGARRSRRPRRRAAAARSRPRSRRRPSRRAIPTRLTSRRSAARPATSARSPRRRCSPTTTTSRRTSRT